MPEDKKKRKEESKIEDVADGAVRFVRNAVKEAASFVKKIVQGTPKALGKVGKASTIGFGEIKKKIAESSLPIGDDWQIHNEAKTQEFNKKELGINWNIYTRQKDGKNEVAFGIPRALFSDDAINKIDKYLSQYAEGEIYDLESGKSRLADALDLESQRLNDLGKLHKEFLKLGGGFEIKEERNSYRKELIVKIPLTDTYEEFEKRVEKTLHSLGINDAQSVKEATKRLWKPPIVQFPERDERREESVKLETDKRPSPEDLVNLTTDDRAMGTNTQPRTSTSVGAQQSGQGVDSVTETDPERKNVDVQANDTNTTNAQTNPETAETGTQKTDSGAMGSQTNTETMSIRTQAEDDKESFFDAPHSTTENIQDAELITTMSASAPITEDVRNATLENQMVDAPQPTVETVNEANKMHQPTQSGTEDVREAKIVKNDLFNSPQPVRDDVRHAEHIINAINAEKEQIKRAEYKSQMNYMPILQSGPEIRDAKLLQNDQESGYDSDSNFEELGIRSGEDTKEALLLYNNAEYIGYEADRSIDELEVTPDQISALYKVGPDIGGIQKSQYDAKKDSGLNKTENLAKIALGKNLAELLEILKYKKVLEDSPISTKDVEQLALANKNLQLNLEFKVAPGSKVEPSGKYEAAQKGSTKDKESLFESCKVQKGTVRPDFMGGLKNLEALCNKNSSQSGLDDDERRNLQSAKKCINEICENIKKITTFREFFDNAKGSIESAMPEEYSKADSLKKAIQGNPSYYKLTYGIDSELDPKVTKEMKKAASTLRKSGISECDGGEKSPDSIKNMRIDTGQKI